MIYKLVGKDYITVRELSDRHVILKDPESGTLKFLKLLRSNTAERTKEIISELLTERIFSLIEISGLSLVLVSFKNKPALFMEYFSDFREPVEVPLEKTKMLNREYFATALFLGDKLVKNTDRAPDRTDHMGWKDGGAGEIVLCPLDNGNSLGHGDENMDTDDDLTNEAVWSQHFSSTLIADLSPTFVEDAILKIEAIDFELEARSIEQSISQILLPTEEEVQFISWRITKAIDFLTRRRPKVIDLLRKLAGSQVKPESEAIISEQPVIMAGVN